MRDIGIVTTADIPKDALLKLLDSYAAGKGERVSHSTTESIIGHGRNALYVRNLPPENNAYYDEDERIELERKLGGAVKASVSIHFTSTESAKKLALDLARKVQETWGGLLDYGGLGGGLGVPPQT